MNPQDQARVRTQGARVRPAVPEGAAPAVTPVPMPAPMPVFAEDDAARVEAPIPKPAQANPATPIYPRAQERRRSPRQTLVAKAVVRSEFNQTTVATGFLSNISMLGVGFHTRRPLTVGEKFQMRLELGPMKWATRLRIVSCQPHDAGTFDVGAEFVGNDLAGTVQRVAAA